MQAISRYEAELWKIAVEKTNVAARIGFSLNQKKLPKLFMMIRY